MSKKNNKTEKSKNKKFPNIPEGVKVSDGAPKKFFSIFLVILLGLSIFNIARQTTILTGVETIEHKDVSMSVLQETFKKGDYSEVTLKGNVVRAEYPETKKTENGREITIKTVDVVEVPPNMNLADLHLQKSDIDPNVNAQTVVKYLPPDLWDNTVEVSGSILSTIILFLLFLFLLSRMMGGNGGPMGGAMSFIRSRAKMYDPDGKDKVTFADVAGSEEEKSDLEEVVDFLKNPEKYKKLGAKIPRGILLQ